uniref:Putative dehydrogenase n=1 Tax=Nyssomyia neivai TaxID=330878 RepID=A0A1L8E4Y4_9DIPT
MDRWVGKVAVVTGASAGIGAEIAKDLVKSGIRVVGLARRAERVEALKNGLSEDVRNNFYALMCDVSKEEEIVATFAKITEDFGGVDILINNAGIGKFDVKLTDRGSSAAINEIVQTNVMGVINCTREAIVSMRERNVNGQVIHINSSLGHKVVMPPVASFNFNVYPATKFAVTALTDSHRFEMVDENRAIKIASVSPGLVDTEFTGGHLTAENFKQIPHLLPQDISQAVLYVLSTPPHVNVQEVLLKPVGCSY